MEAIKALFMRLVSQVMDEAGAVATEYGLTLLFIALAIVLAATAFGVALSGLFEQGPPAFPAS
jgi:Flp pilus assembly pilin Flp